MLARYFPGKGICYVDSVSVKQKLKNADMFRRTNRAVCVTKCFNNPILNGGTPSSVPSYFVNGGSPLSNPTCYINTSNPTSCYNNSILNGGTPSSIPSYFVNGGSSSSSQTCYVSGGHV